MAANDVDIVFLSMGEAGLRQWVEANPGRVNDSDSMGYTPLVVAVRRIKSVPLILWLEEEKGADVNIADQYGYTPLHVTVSLDVLIALLDCDVDPTLLGSNGLSPLMGHVIDLYSELIVRLLQDPRVQASVNVQGCDGNTALHFACLNLDKPEMPAIIQLLLEAGADLLLTDEGGETPLAVLQDRHPTYPITLALLEESLDAEKASFLVKARRLVMAATRTTPPSHLQGRVGHGLPLPVVALAPATDESKEEGEEARRKLHTMLAWVVGMEGGHMPPEVFRVVLELLMPWWDPLRRKV